MAKSQKGSKLILGAHLSISGGLHKSIIEAESLGCNALQIFTKNSSTWKEKYLTAEQIAEFDKVRKETGITAIVAHTAYLINLASNDHEIRKKSKAALEQELIRCDQLNIPWLVMHPGSHMGDGIDIGIKRIVDAVNVIHNRLPKNTTRLLFETTAGQGNSIGHTFDQLAEIMDLILDKNRIGICLDTCHIFAAGYNLADSQSCEDTIKQFDIVIGIDNLHVIHINDAKKACGSRVDRHAHIGEGKIGMQAFSFIINDKRMAHIPKIIETPKKKDGKDVDWENLDKLRSVFKSAI